MAQCYDEFGPQWCSSKITWADIVNAVLDVGSKNTITDFKHGWSIKIH